MELLTLFLVGMAGAAAKDVVEDGHIRLPYIDGHKLVLGFVGSAFLGGCVGLVVDGSLLTSFLGGYVGFSIIEQVIIKKING